MSDNPAFLAHAYGLAHTDCWCARCETEAKARLAATGGIEEWRVGMRTFMHLCPDCGNKRCPRATDHRNACTGSNDPGQPGSAYGPPSQDGLAEFERFIAALDREFPPDDIRELDG